MKLRWTVSLALACLVVLSIALVGCGESTKSKQAYIDDVLRVMGDRYADVEVISLADMLYAQATTVPQGQQNEEERSENSEEQRSGNSEEERKPEQQGTNTTQEEVERAKTVVKQGWENTERYIASGYTDLVAAQNAAKYYDELITGEEQALVLLKKTKVPDADAERIYDELERGLNKATEADRQIAAGLKRAPDQQQAERKATAEALYPLQSTYEEALRQMTLAMDEAIRYVRTNKLSGEQDLLMWKQLLQEEQQSVSAFKPPA